MQRLRALQAAQERLGEAMEGEGIAKVRTEERVMKIMVFLQGTITQHKNLEMTYPSLVSELKQKIKSIVVKEFEGIDNLSNNPGLL